MANILQVNHLIKKYKNLTAVNDISFSIKQGICFGLLGPNGAGKTSTIEVIEGVLEPTSGEILYKGKPLQASFRQEVGIQFQQTALLSFLKVHETLKTFQALFHKNRPLEELIELCQLQEFLNQYNDRISGGQKQRFLLAVALANDPEILFLDEPSTGLDPNARRNLWKLIQKIKNEGKTIILTTHYMEEAEHLCDEIAIMDYGKIIAQGSPQQVINEHFKDVTVILPKASFKFPLEKLSFNAEEVNGKVEIKTKNINQCLERLLAMDISLSGLVVHSPNLEDVFITLTGRKIKE